MFVNCQLCGWVIRIEPSRMVTVLVRCESLLISSSSASGLMGLRILLKWMFG